MVQVAADGSIFSYGNSFFDGEVPQLNKRDTIEPVAALQGATSTLQLGVNADAATAESTGGVETFTIKGTTGAVKDPEARLVYLQTEGSLKLVWRVETDIYSNWLLTYVDASGSSEVHAVVDYSADATYQV